MDPFIQQHRVDFAELIKRRATGPFKEILPRLYRDWDRWNEQFFEGKLIVPYILLTETRQGRHLGDCAPITCFGSLLQIRIRPDIILGTHSVVKTGTKDAEGLYLFTADVLLHEMIHQYQFEVLHDSEEKYKGHGPIFRDICNRIGKVLGLEEVRVARKTGSDDRASCAYWPDNVRPDADTYYRGVLPVRRADKPRLPKPKTDAQMTVEATPGEDEPLAPADESTSDGHTPVVPRNIDSLWLVLAREAHRLSPSAKDALEKLQQQYAQ